MLPGEPKDFQLKNHKNELNQRINILRNHLGTSRNREGGEMMAREMVSARHVCLSLARIVACSSFTRSFMF